MHVLTPAFDQSLEEHYRSLGSCDRQLPQCQDVRWHTWDDAALLLCWSSSRRYVVRYVVRDVAGVGDLQWS
jgi:hypothetical protein